MRAVRVRAIREMRSRIRRYSLVVTGHSLGAGVAALLSLLLARAYGTSPTPGAPPAVRAAFWCGVV